MLNKGQMGRVAIVRLRPNQDLCEAVVAACGLAGFDYAMVKSAVGSLNNAMLNTANGDIRHDGIGIEILSLNGDVCLDQNGDLIANLSGIISRPDQQVFGGRFVKGENIICITIELVLQEWLPND